MKERKVGEVFTFGNVNLKVEINDSCKECYFEKYKGSSNIDRENKIQEAIAWLEKQVEKIDYANKEYWRGYKEGKQVIIDKYAEIEKKGEQKPAWSEEDEHRVKGIIYFLDTAKKHYASTIELDACISWLKSLKPHQSHWKPSNEHYELEEFAKIVRDNLTGISKEVQSLFENKYLQLTGNKMYGGYIE